MKKLLSILGLFVYSFFHSQTAASVFTSDNLVYYGVDYSNCRLVGNFGNGDGHDMKIKMFPGWNELIVKERQKFDFETAFKKQSIYYDLNPVILRNMEADESKIMTYNNTFKLDKPTINEMVKAYGKGEKESGIGLVFIAEYLDKNTERASYYVTFFDIATKTVLLTENVTGQAIGVGLRNYWANSVFDALKTIRMRDYNAWKYKYGKEN